MHVGRFGILASLLLLTGTVWTASPFGGLGARAESTAEHAPQTDAGADTIAYAGPRMVFAEPVFDFGQAEQGEQVTHLFRFTNQGNRDLRVVSIKTSCGCTAAVISADVIPPGKEGTIRATFDTTQFSGEKAKSISVHSNDPLSPVTTLTLQGEVTVEVEVEPAQLYIGRLRRGTEETYTVHVLYDEKKAIEITGITHTHPAIKVQTEDVQIGGKKGKRLRVRVTKAAELGRLNDQIVVTTTSKKKPTITIPVFGSIEGDVMVLPPQVSFGVVRQGVGKTQHIRIQNRSTQPVTVLQVTSSLDNVVAEITEITPGKEYRLSLHVKADSTPGKIRGSIEVLTDHPEEKHLSIPLYGMISASQQAGR